MTGFREKGRVVAVDETGASVRIVPVSPESCATCGGCGSEDPGGARLLRVPPMPGLLIGDEVIVETAPITRLSASLLVLLVPMLGLLGGAIAGNIWGPRLGLGAEGGSILGGLTLLALTYLIVARVDRRIRVRHGVLRPRILPVNRT